ncbi:hypothetical protein ACFLQ7_02700, partial [Actinomycetota bacterium]
MTRFRWVLAILVITVVGILAPSLVGARVFLGTDLLEAFSPWSTEAPDDVVVTNPLVGDTVDSLQRVLLSDRLRAGDMAPLWDGHVHGGQPVASVPTHALYSPFNIGVWVLPAWYAPITAKALELFAAIGFMYLFLRRLGLARFSAALAGFVFAFSGFQVVWTNWSQAHVGALIPGLFWAIEYTLAKRRAASIVPLAVIVAVMWLEGFPSVTVYALVFAGVYTVVRCCTHSELRPALVSAGTALAAVLAGTALAAFQLIPFAFFVRGIDAATRIQEPNWHLARRTLATLAVPNAFGSPADVYFGPADYLIYGPVNYVEIQAFIGIAALGLIAVAAVYGRRVVGTPLIAYLWVSIASIAFVMYAASPLLDLVHSLPLIGTNHIGRLRSVFLFLLAVLVGIGAEALIRRLPSRSNRAQRAGLAAA